MVAAAVVVAALALLSPLSRGRDLRFDVTDIPPWTVAFDSHPDFGLFTATERLRALAFADKADCTRTCNGKDVHVEGGTYECWGKFKQTCKGEGHRVACSSCDGALFVVTRGKEDSEEDDFLVAARCEGMSKSFFVSVEAAGGKEMLQASGYGCLGINSFILNPSSNGTKEYIACSDHSGSFHAVKLATASDGSTDALMEEVTTSARAFMSQMMPGPPPDALDDHPPPLMDPRFAHYILEDDLVSIPDDRLAGWAFKRSLRCVRATESQARALVKSAAGVQVDPAVIAADFQAALAEEAAADGDATDVKEKLAAEDNDDDDDDEKEEDDEEEEEEEDDDDNDDEDDDDEDDDEKDDHDEDEGEGRDDDDEDKDGDDDDDDDDNDGGDGDGKAHVECKVTCNGHKPFWHGVLPCRGTFEVECDGVTPTGKCFDLDATCKGLTVPWAGFCWGLHTFAMEADDVEILAVTSGKYFMRPIRRGAWEGIMSFRHGKSSIHIGGEGYGRD